MESAEACRELALLKVLLKVPVDPGVLAGPLLFLEMVPISASSTFGEGVCTADSSEERGGAPEEAGDKAGRVGAGGMAGGGGFWGGPPEGLLTPLAPAFTILDMMELNFLSGLDIAALLEWCSCKLGPVALAW